MIDIHNHIIWGVDDGAASLDDSLQMAQQAVKIGIHKIIATPHYHESKFETNVKEVLDKTQQLNNTLKSQNIPLDIIAGQEIRINENLLIDLKSNKIMPINGNSRYILLEFPFHELPYYIINLIVELVDNNYVPIIAHPERNLVIQENYNLLNQLVDKGCILQMNAGSLLNKHSKKAKLTAKYMVKQKKFHILGSDAHDVLNRKFYINKALRKIHNSEFKNYLQINAEAVWQNTKINIFKYF